MLSMKENIQYKCTTEIQVIVRSELVTKSPLVIIIDIYNIVTHQLQSLFVNDERRRWRDITYR